MYRPGYVIMQSVGSQLVIELLFLGKGRLRFQDLMAHTLGNVLIRSVPAFIRTIRNGEKGVSRPNRA